MPKIRIQRKRKTDSKMMINWAHFLTLIFRRMARPQIQANLSYMQELRAEDIKARTAVSDMRKQKLANDLVMQDMKIELMKAELKARGIGGNEFAPPSHYESEEQH